MNENYRRSNNDGKDFFPVDSFSNFENFDGPRGGGHNRNSNRPYPSNGHFCHNGHMQHNNNGGRYNNYNNHGPPDNSHNFQQRQNGPSDRNEYGYNNRY